MTCLQAVVGLLKAGLLCIWVHVHLLCFSLFVSILLIFAHTCVSSWLVVFMGSVWRDCIFFLPLIYSAYAPGIKGSWPAHTVYAHHYSHTVYPYSHSHTYCMRIGTYGLIWFWNKIKLTRSIMAQFRQIIKGGRQSLWQIESFNGDRGVRQDDQGELKKKKENQRGSRDESVILFAHSFSKAGQSSWVNPLTLCIFSASLSPPPPPLHLYSWRKDCSHVTLPVTYKENPVRLFTF